MLQFNFKFDTAFDGKAWVSSSVKPHVEDSAIIDQNVAQKIRPLLFLPDTSVPPQASNASLGFCRQFRLKRKFSSSSSSSSSFGFINLILHSHLDQLACGVETTVSITFHQSPALGIIDRYGSIADFFFFVSNASTDTTLSDKAGWVVIDCWLVTASTTTINKQKT